VATGAPAELMTGILFTLLIADVDIKLAEVSVVDPACKEDEAIEEAEGEPDDKLEADSVGDIPIRLDGVDCCG
jgi:hypothetical protein